MVNEVLVVEEEFGAVEKSPEDVAEGVGGGVRCGGGFKKFEAFLDFVFAGTAAESGKEDGFESVFVGHQREIHD